MTTQEINENEYSIVYHSCSKSTNEYPEQQGMNKEQGDEENNNNKKESILEGVSLALQTVPFFPVVPSLLSWFFLHFLLCPLLVIFLSSSSPIFSSEPLFLPLLLPFYFSFESNLTYPQTPSCLSPPESVDSPSSFACKLSCSFFSSKPLPAPCSYLDHHFFLSRSSRPLY